MAAYLSHEEIISRREEQSSVLLSQQALVSGHSHYRIKCACRLNPCEHENDTPVLYLTRCLLPGELDHIIVNEPFLADYNFTASWLCMECKAEYCCGIDENMR